MRQRQRRRPLIEAVAGDPKHRATAPAQVEQWDPRHRHARSSSKAATLSRVRAVTGAAGIGQPRPRAPRAMACLLSARRSGALPERPICAALVRRAPDGPTLAAPSSPARSRHAMRGQEECDPADSGTRDRGLRRTRMRRVRWLTFAFGRLTLGRPCPDPRGAGAMSALFGRSLRRVHDRARHAPVGRAPPSASGPDGPGSAGRTVRPPRTIVAAVLRISGGARGGRDQLLCRRVHAELVTEAPGQIRQSRPGLELPVFVGMWRIRPRPLVFRSVRLDAREHQDPAGQDPTAPHAAVSR